MLLNRGDGSFRARRDYATGFSPVSVAIGDLNGDGKPELATANYNANTISVLANAGDGSFQSKIDYSTGSGPRSVAIGDLNGDGKLDVATANWASNTVSVLINTPGLCTVQNVEGTAKTLPAAKRKDRARPLAASGRSAAPTRKKSRGRVISQAARAGHGPPAQRQGQPRRQPRTEEAVVRKLVATRKRIALVCAAVVVLGGSLGIFLASRGSDVVSLGRGTEMRPSRRSPTRCLAALLRGLVCEGRPHRSRRTDSSADPFGSGLRRHQCAARRSHGGRAQVGLDHCRPRRYAALGISLTKRIATVDLTSEYQSGGGSLSLQKRLAQVVYTLTQFPSVGAVRFRLDGSPVDVFSGEGIILDHPVGRSDYKDLAPTSPTVTGTWRLLPRAPIPDPDLILSVWTGKEMIVFGRVEKRGPADEILGSKNVAAAYDPAANTWRGLAPPLSAPGYPGNWDAVWTGKEMLVWGDVNQAFDPAKDRWRRLPPAPSGRGGILVWTGSELIDWGGGCCGDVSSDGAAYNPSTDSWRKIAPPPVPGQQSPVGAWTGKELVIFPGRSPDGKPVGGAAYNPATNTWRRMGSRVEPPGGAFAAWDGYEVLVAGGTRQGFGLSKRRPRLQPGDGSLAPALCDRLRPRGVRRGVDGQAAARLGRSDVPWRGCDRRPRIEL